MFPSLLTIDKDLNEVKEDLIKNEVEEENQDSMRYKFKILDGDTGVNSETENMSYKKALKHILITKPKFNGALYYTNKKGNYVMHSISNGKRS